MKAIGLPLWGVQCTTRVCEAAELFPHILQVTWYLGYFIRPARLGTYFIFRRLNVSGKVAEGVNSGWGRFHGIMAGAENHKNGGLKLQAEFISDDFPDT